MSQVNIIAGKEYTSGKVTFRNKNVPLGIIYFVMQNDSLYYFNTLLKELEASSLNDIKFIEYKVGNKIGKYAGVGLLSSSVGVLLKSLDWKNMMFYQLTPEQKIQNYKFIGISTVVFGVIGYFSDKPTIIYFTEKKSISFVPKVNFQNYNVALKIKI